MIAAVDEKHVRSLLHEHVGCANVTTLTTLNYFCDYHVRITPTALERNDKKWKEAYDPNQTFETLIDQVEDAMEHGAAKKTPTDQYN